MGPGTVTSNYANNYSLPANTTVYYQIAAYNANGEGPRSNVVSATTLSAGNYSLNGVWESSGWQTTVSGSTSVLSKFGTLSALEQSARDKGYLTIGGTYWRNITSTGYLTWSGQVLSIQWNTPNVAIGTTWNNITFTMSADGQTLTVDGSVIWRRK